MIATITINEILHLAEGVGLKFAVTEQPSLLYVWATPENEVLYIGKSESPTRVRDELTWLDTLDPHGDNLHSGIVHLLRRNHGRPQPLHFIGFDPAPLRAHIRDWTPDGLAKRVHAFLAADLTVAKLETVLIRICIRMGVPIGNSRDASQWEVATDCDAVAAIAADQVEGAYPSAQIGAISLGLADVLASGTPDDDYDISSTSISIPPMTIDE